LEQKNRTIIIFLAGELKNEKNVLSLFQDEMYACYAADGGYLLAQRLNVRVDKILGDFDSAPKPSLEGILVYPSEKDQTDSELALHLALADGYRDIWMIAPFGGRLDHTIANICLLEAAFEKGASLKLYDGENLAFILPRGRHAISNKYRYISFFPWNGDATVSLNGVKYPLDHYELKTYQPIGVSNEPLGEPEIEIHDGLVLCICVENNQEDL